MTPNRLILPLLCASLVALPALAQNAAPAQSSMVRKDPVRADAYYNFTMGHIFEQQYDQTDTLHATNPKRRKYSGNQRLAA